MQVYAKIDKEVFGDELPIFFSGCDYKCPFCNVPELIAYGELVELRQVKEYIDSQSVKTVIFTGGEPCLQRLALVNLARHCKSKGLRVIIDTNGSKPDTLRSLLMSNLVDEIRMDIKSPFESIIFEKVTRSKTFFVDTLSLLDDISQSIKLLQEHSNKVDIVFETLIVPSLIFKKEDILEIAELIKDIRCTFVLKRFESSNHIDKRYNEISPPTMHFLGSLREIISKKYPMINMQVHGQGL